MSLDECNQSICDQLFANQHTKCEARKRGRSDAANMKETKVSSKENLGRAGGFHKTNCQVKESGEKGNDDRTGQRSIEGKMGARFWRKVVQKFEIKFDYHWEMKEIGKRNWEKKFTTIGKNL